MGVSPMSCTVVPTVQTHGQALGAPKGMAVVLAGKMPVLQGFPQNVNAPIPRRTD